MRPFTVLAAITIALALQFSPPAGRDAQAIPAITLAPVVTTGLGQPVALTHAGDTRLFITDQNGIIRAWNGTTLSTFLDISTKVVCCGEQGLLSVAFHPNYPVTPYFYVNYTDDDGTPGDTVIARYTVSADPNTAIAGSEQIMMTIGQPYTNHNGGQLQFGPDGYLYIGMGDGGNGDDPQNYGQRDDTLLGKMLRIDVNNASPPYYSIPPSNPHVGAGDPPDEVWAKGLRNPWRFSFDRLTGDMFIGDVGQDQREEVDFQPASSSGGENYGWRLDEGTFCNFAGCGNPAFTDPILEYTHAGGNCSITGGYRYRGSAYPGLNAVYFYGDYCTGQIWGAEFTTGWATTALLNSPYNISAFGEDVNGELYVVHLGGAVYKITVAADTDGDAITDTNDNCSGVSNPGQEANDANFIELGPSKAYDDLTRPRSDIFGNACETDDDNDGLTDAAEASLPGAACPSASAATSATNEDSDGDRTLDGAECTFGYDPANAASKPPPIIAPDADSDGLPDALDPDDADTDTDDDGVRDGIEVRHYNTSPTDVNSDNDACYDGKEVASINVDNTVNSVDLAQVAQGFGNSTQPQYLVDFDTNKDGTINALDLSFVAQRFGGCP